MAAEGGRVSSSEADDLIGLGEGEQRVGEFHCAECGYGIVSRRTLPACPMCQGTTWDESPWRPFSRDTNR